MDAFQQALAAHRAGDLVTAKAGYAPLRDDPRAMYNLGLIYAQEQQFAAAEPCFRRSVELAPGKESPAFALALELLSQGRYAEAWPHYEARRKLFNLFAPDPASGMVEWTGQPLDGKRILVAGEQGFGDQIQFARFLPALAAAEVTYYCGPALAPLFEGAPFAVAPASRGAPAPAADYWTVVGSLPLRLGVTLETLPPPFAPPIELRRGAGVGVAARGRPSHANDAHRSLHGDDAERLLSLGRDLSPEATGARDFRQTAEIIAGLDLVITVDTAIAHLAATLGAPTWILLSARDPDFRWLRGRSDSPWYPTARLFRQREPGDWASTLDAVEAELAQIAGNGWARPASR